MHAVVAACWIGLLVCSTPPARGLARQTEPTVEDVALAGAVRERFEVDLGPDGLTLASTGADGVIRVIALADGVVAVDGVPVSGAELRELFGADADLVLRITYLGDATRRALFGADPVAAGAPVTAPTSSPVESASGAEAEPAGTPEQPRDEVADAAGTAVVERPAPAGQAAAAVVGAGAPGQVADAPVLPEPAVPEPGIPAPAVTGSDDRATVTAERTAVATTAGDQRSSAGAPERTTTTRGDLFRLGGSVSVERHERVRGDAAVVLGSLSVDGEVTGDVVVIAGSARFGPEAVVRGDVTVVGGSLHRARSASLRGSVTQVGLAGIGAYTDPGRRWQVGWPGAGWLGGGDLVATTVRLFLLALLASGVVFLARGPAERIARRASAEPIKSGVVGMLAQLMVVPLLVSGILVLVISIVGIPLLLLLPFVIGGIGLVMLVGFSGAVLGAGEWIRNRMGAPGPAAFASVWAGIALVLLPTMAGEAVGMAGGLLRGLGVLLVLSGFLLEYAAWTAGLGALILNRFSPAPTTGLPGPTSPVAPPPAPSVAPPPVDPVETPTARPAAPSNTASAPDPPGTPPAPASDSADANRHER